MAIVSLPITIAGIRKAFGDHVALDDVSLDIAAGEFLTLLGPSGSGKTTLLMALAGFVRPDVGYLTIGDRDVTRLPPNLRNIGIVFQNYALFPHMSVLANVEYPLKLRRVPKREARARTEAALERVKLAGFGDRSVAALSGGQRQRVALARAIVFEPRVMLMDEPLSALDKNLREHMQFEIRKLHDDLGITTIYVTHDQREALTMSDRIAVMDAGRIQQIGAPSEIYYRPKNRFVAEFMGEANILAADRLSGPGTRSLSGRGLAMIRAENFDLNPDIFTNDRVEIAGRLLAKAFRGENWLLHIETSAGDQLALSIPSALAGACPDLTINDELRAFTLAGHVHTLAEGPQT
jgi:putative spermidine/putrescine transport system ATP-binding protein